MFCSNQCNQPGGTCKQCHLSNHFAQLCSKRQSTVPSKGQNKFTKQKHKSGPWHDREIGQHCWKSLCKHKMWNVGKWWNCHITDRRLTLCLYVVHLISHLQIRCQWCGTELILHHWDHVRQNWRIQTTKTQQCGVCGSEWRIDTCSEPISIWADETNYGCGE